MKNWKSRVLVLMLVLIMAVSVLPVAAMAAEETEGYTLIVSDIFGSANDRIVENHDWNGSGNFNLIEVKAVGPKPVTVKAEDYDNLVTIDGQVYELEGIHTVIKEDTVVGNGVTSVTIPAFPADGTDEEKNAWYAKWSSVLLAYAPHQHDAAYWTYSKTNHWINCTECGESLLMMNWHSDYDADDICDVCGGPIVYYDVTIADTEHGTVTIEKDAYRLNDQVNIEVKPDSGYVLDEIMAFKHREDGTSARLVVRADVKGSEYHFKMPSFKCEIVVTFKEA